MDCQVESHMHYFLSFLFVIEWYQSWNADLGLLRQTTLILYDLKFRDITYIVYKECLDNFFVVVVYPVKPLQIKTFQHILIYLCFIREDKFEISFTIERTRGQLKNIKMEHNVCAERKSALQNKKTKHILNNSQME